MTSLPCPTEAQEGKALVAYLRLKGYKFTHIGNESGSTPDAQRRAIRMKQQGLSRGFPDYLVIAHGELYAIELKRVKGSKVAPEQREWLEALAAVGVRAAICHGAKEAAEFIESGAHIHHVEVSKPAHWGEKEAF